MIDEMCALKSSGTRDLVTYTSQVICWVLVSMFSLNKSILIMSIRTN